MKASFIFAGAVLPLVTIPWEFLAYSYLRSLYIGGALVTIGEIVALILVKLITRRKTSLYINSGVMLSIPLILIMTLFPPPSPIGFRYPFLMFPAITGGICEELIYRDCILEKGRYDNYIQAILWSFNHVLDGPTFVFYTFIIGIILGLIARRFGVLPCVIAHVTANTLRIFL